MLCGLDLSDCRFVTDQNGNRLRADIPYSVFSMLLEYRWAALHSEANLHAGDTKDSKDSRSARECLEAIFSATPENATRTAVIGGSDARHDEPQSVSKGHRQVYFPRLFREPVPAEVQRLIGQGIYFLRAWRLYRNLTREEAADRADLTTYTIGRHEHGYHKPAVETLERFALVYACSIDQLVAQDDSDTRPFDPRESMSIQQAVSEMNEDYPGVVLAHLLDGKSALTAWRLYRNMTIDQLADACGSNTQHIARLEEAANLRKRTLDKFARILDCKPVQLLTPANAQPFVCPPRGEPVEVHAGVGK
nr:hypothetical protein HUO10_005174 [Paraburkholderia busanensis]